MSEHKIVQLLFAPTDPTWQGVLLGLGSDGVTYVCYDGRWTPYIPPIGYETTKEPDNEHQS